MAWDGSTSICDQLCPKSRTGNQNSVTVILIYGNTTDCSADILRFTVFVQICSVLNSSAVSY